MEQMPSLPTYRIDHVIYLTYTPPLYSPRCETIRFAEQALVLFKRIGGNKSKLREYIQVMKQSVKRSN